MVCKSHVNIPLLVSHCNIILKRILIVLVPEKGRVIVLNISQCHNDHYAKMAEILVIESPDSTFAAVETGALHKKILNTY